MFVYIQSQSSPPCYVSSGHNAGYQLANVRKTLQLTKTFGIKLHTFLLFEQKRADFFLRWGIFFLR